MRVCHMLGYWWYYITLLVLGFRDLEYFFGEFDIESKRRRELWFVFFSSLLNILFLVSFDSNYGFLPYYGFWM